MQVDYIIVGQGICGTMLSWFLHKEGKTFVVIDDGNDNSSSKVAAGIINPVTGRRYVTTWMIETVMPFAHGVYEEMGTYFDTKYTYHKSLIDFFPSPQMRNAFVDRIAEDDTYLHTYPDQNHFNDYFNYDFGCGEVRPVHIVHLALLLADWRKKLIDMNALSQQPFILNDADIKKDGVTYQNITAQKLIFCDGIASATNPWFKALPFSPNKGEALLIECEELRHDHLFKKGLVLAPTGVRNVYWVGSNYKWEFADEQPTKEFYDHTTSLLNTWLKKPYAVLFHKASVRPATLERRPFVGLHPHMPSIGILNGMGTKGTSLAPFFANQLTQQLVHGLPVTPEADIHRFSRILSK